MHLPSRCANITPASQDRRLRVGVIIFSTTLALAVLLAEVGVPAGFRWALVLPFFGALMAVSQALTKTCPAMASQGMRDRGEGPEKVPDPHERATLRASGRRLVLSSALLALAAAGLFAGFPG